MSAGWQVTLFHSIWHVSSRSDEAHCKLLYFKSNKIKSNIFAQTYHIYTSKVVKSVYELGQQG